MVQRIFTEDIHTSKGELRFRKGTVSSDYPDSTWNDIARSLEKDLDDFTAPLTGIAGISVPVAEVTRKASKPQRVKRKITKARHAVSA